MNKTIVLRTNRTGFDDRVQIRNGERVVSIIQSGIWFIIESDGTTNGVAKKVDYSYEVETNIIDLLSEGMLWLNDETNPGLNDDEMDSVKSSESKHEDFFPHNVDEAISEYMMRTGFTQDVAIKKFNNVFMYIRNFNREDTWKDSIKKAIRIIEDNGAEDANELAEKLYKNGRFEKYPFDEHSTLENFKYQITQGLKGYLKKCANESFNFDW